MKLAEQGDREAQFVMGRYYMHQNDWANAVKWYEQSAAQNHPKAQNNLGLAYMEGRGVQQNVKLGCHYMMLSYEQMRTPEGADNVAMCNDQNGKGSPEELKVALEHYQIAAEAGIAQAQFALGDMYERGEGTEKQPEKAIYWYRKSAEQEYIKAIVGLAIVQLKAICAEPKKQYNARRRLAVYLLSKHAQEKLQQLSPDEQREIEQHYQLSEKLNELESRMPDEVKQKTLEGYARLNKNHDTRSFLANLDEYILLQ